MSSTSATTTYSFTYTTFSNPTPVAFTKPTEFPTIFSFGSAVGCPSATAAPSNAPLDHPSGHDAACAISNDASLNDHAFWDLYACCSGGDMTAFGTPMPCTAQCKPHDGQTWQELGDCLSKKVHVVVCKPALAELPANASQSHGAGQTSSRPPSTASASASPTGTSGASHTYAGQAFPSKAALAVVVGGILALGSAAGMLL